MNIYTRSENNEMILREGTAPDIFVFRGRKFIANSPNSFIELVKSRADKTKSVTAYNEDGVRCILDDSEINIPFETITYRYQLSVQAKEWDSILTNGKTFEHKEMINFIKMRNKDEVDNLELLLSSIKNFKYALNISGDYSIDDRNNYTVAISVGETEGTIKIPSLVEVEIELFEESDYKQIFEIEIEILRPRNENEKPKFLLSCPKFKRYEKNAKNHILKNIKDGLKEYLVVSGTI